MNHGIRRFHQRAVIVIGQAKTFACQISAENADARVEIFEEYRKLKMQLQRAPKPFARFLLRFCPDQQIQLAAMPGQEPRHHVAAQIAG